MSRVESLFAPAKPTGIKPDTKNADGYPAFTVSLEEDYVQMVMTNTIGNTYYMDKKQLFENSMQLHAAMLKKNPKFMAQTAIYSRNASLMRSQPIIALAHLSMCEDKRYFKAAFDKVVRTPNDLIDFVTVVGNLRKGRGLGRSIKREVNNFLNKMSQYWVIKYGGGSEGWTLKDIIKACHPNPLTKAQGSLFSYLTTGQWNENLDQIKCVESLKKLSSEDKDYTNKVIELIERGRLPHEIVTGIVKPNTAIWEYLMKQMPIFALTRNLNTLERAGVFAKKNNVEYVVGQLTNPEIIAKSRMLPFRFSTAHKQFTGDPRISNALAKALDLSLLNAQAIEGSTAWFLDVSGSMGGDFLEIGAILALAGLKQSKDSFMLNFESNLHCPRVNPDDTVMSNLTKAYEGHGGGTNTGLCIEYLLGAIDPEKKTDRLFYGGGYAAGFPASMRTQEKTKVDNIVIVTDEVQNSGSPVVSLFRKYRKEVNRNAKLFIIDIAPYTGKRLVNDNEPGVTFIYGWSDAVLDILRYSAEGNGKHVDIIRNIAIVD